MYNEMPQDVVQGKNIGRTGAHNNLLISIPNKQMEKIEGDNDARALINQSIKSNQGILQRDDTFSFFFIPNISEGK